MTIYIDVLIVLNMYINYFLIRAAALFMRRAISTQRCIVASAVGALFSAVVLLPELPFPILCLIKVLSGIMIVYIAFGRTNIIDFLISLLSFLVISFIFAGSMIALWTFAAPYGMLYRNGIAYFDIPILAVAIMTMIGYGMVRLVQYVADKRNLSVATADITIEKEGCTVKLKGIADTGNSLCDPFSGKSVIICYKDNIAAIIPENVSCYLNGDTLRLDRIRLVPCNTIAGHALIPVFSASVNINGRNADAVVGVTSQPLGADCIFNPKLISL